VPFYLLLLDWLEKLTDEYTWILELPNTAKNKTFQEINESVRNAYELYYSFSPPKADAGGWKTHEWSRTWRKRPAATAIELHLHNVARQLNSLYGIIFILKHRPTKD